jgi:hypothetical protein
MCSQKRMMRIFVVMAAVICPVMLARNSRADQAATSASARPVTRSYDVHDLILGAYADSLTAPDLVGGDGDTAAKEGMAITPEQYQQDLIDKIVHTVEMQSWKSVPAIQAEHGVLVIQQTEDVHTKIAALLDQLRKAGEPQVKVETQFFEASSDVNTDNPLRDRQLVEAKMRAAHMGGVEPLSESDFISLDDLALNNPNVRSAATSMEMGNGKSGYTLLGGSFRYVKGYDAMGSGNQLRFEPHMATCTIGKLCYVKRALVSADHKYVTLDMELEYSRLDWIDTVVFDAERHLNIQRPNISMSEMRSRVTLPVTGGMFYSFQPLNGWPAGKIAGHRNGKNAVNGAAAPPEVYLLLRVSIQSDAAVTQAG